MPKPKPVCESVFPWLRANLGKGCCAALTGQDTRALQAAVQIVELYSYCDDKLRVAGAFRAVVGQIQRKCWFLAYHSIAHVMDWPDRHRLWSQAAIGYPFPTDDKVILKVMDPSIPFDGEAAFGRCAFEPKSLTRSLQGPDGISAEPVPSGCGSVLHPELCQCADKQPQDGGAA